ncbi:hypothetical protein HK405_008753 [Cladochytrium tenue]|nr:hypothetical protein HK405_008753 [Cladochytrium tenue]
MHSVNFVTPSRQGPGPTAPANRRRSPLPQPSRMLPSRPPPSPRRKRRSDPLLLLLQALLAPSLSMLLLVLLPLLLFAWAATPAAAAPRRTSPNASPAAAAAVADEVSAAAALAVGTSGVSSSYSFKLAMNVTSSEHPHTTLMGMINNIRSAAATTSSASNSSTSSSGSDVASAVTPNTITEYRAQLSIGTPAQTFNMLFDTGSFDLWVVSSKCTSTICKSASNMYNTANSSTYVNPGQTAHGDSYADGSSVKGNVAIDTVSVGAYSITSFQFTEATSFTSSSTSTDFDGIVGMSLNVSSSYLGYSVNEPLVDTMVGRGVLPAAKFGYYVNTAGTAGELTFGGYDSNYFANSSAYVNWFSVSTDSSITNVGEWALPINSITVGTTTTTISATSSGPAVVIMDTGTSLGLIPMAALDSFASISGATKYAFSTGTYDYLYEVSCSLMSSLTSPVFTLNMGNGGTLLLNPSDYIVKIDTNFCIIGFYPSESSAGIGTNVVLMGNTFLKRYYSIFDYENRRIGFTVALGRSGSTGVVGSDGSSVGSAAVVRSAAAPARTAVAASFPLAAFVASVAFIWGVLVA